MAKRVYGKKIQDDVILDKYALDVEAENQPSLLLAWTDQTAEARQKKEQLERFLKTRTSELEMEVRRGSPKDYGLEKFIEVSIDSIVGSYPELAKITEEMLAAREEHLLCENAVDAIREKGRMVSVEKDLWIAGYYSASNNV